MTPKMGGYTPADHAGRHEDGGRDEVSVASLSGTPAALTTHAAVAAAHHAKTVNAGDLNAGTLLSQRLSANQKFVPLEFSIGDGVNELTTGLQFYVQIDFACTIIAAKLLAKESGSVVIDIWKQAFADFPPEDANSITASAPPTLSGAQSVEDTTLTGWTKAIADGDCLGFNVDSVTTITQVTLILKVSKA